MSKARKIVVGTHNQRLSKLVQDGYMKYSDILDNEEYTDDYLDTKCEWFEGSEYDYFEEGFFDRLFNDSKIDEDDDEF